MVHISKLGVHMNSYERGNIPDSAMGSSSCRLLVRASAKTGQVSIHVVFMRRRYCKDCSDLGE